MLFRSSLQAMSPEAMMQSWMTGLKSLDELRERFLAGMAGGGKP